MLDSGIAICIRYRYKRDKGVDIFSGARREQYIPSFDITCVRAALGTVLSDGELLQHGHTSAGLFKLEEVSLCVAERARVGIT